MKYHFELYPDEQGYWTLCRELDGCCTQGDSLEAIYANCLEALNGYLDEPEDSTMLVPLPDPRLEGQPNIIAVPVEPEIARRTLTRLRRLGAMTPAGVL
jgi:predicted RNase H-like HicB family nuclease